MIVAGGVISIFIFYFLSFTLDFRIGVSVLTAWFFMILYCLWVDRYISKFVILDTVSDFMYISLDKKLDIKLVDKLVSRYFYMQISEIKEKVEKDDDIPKDLKEQFHISFVSYIEQNFAKGQEITSEELKEINEAERVN
jgi:hypothetical protein